MMEEVAEKAATRAAEVVAKDLKLEMIEANHQLKEDLVAEIERQLQKHMGMTPLEHAQQHDRIKRFMDLVASVSAGFWKKVGMGLIVLALSVGAGKTIDIKALINPKPEPAKELKHETHK